MNTFLEFTDRIDDLISEINMLRETLSSLETEYKTLLDSYSDLQKRYDYLINDMKYTLRTYE